MISVKKVTEEKKKTRLKVIQNLSDKNKLQVTLAMKQHGLHKG